MARFAVRANVDKRRKPDVARSIDSTGRLRLPPEVKRRLKLESGDSVGFFFEGDRIWISKVEFVATE